MRDSAEEKSSEMQAVECPVMSMAHPRGAVSTVQSQLLDILHESESQRKEVFSAFETAVRTAQQLQVLFPCSSECCAATLQAEAQHLRLGF